MASSWHAMTLKGLIHAGVLVFDVNPGCMILAQTACLNDCRRAFGVHSVMFVLVLCNQKLCRHCYAASFKYFAASTVIGPMEPPRVKERVETKTKRLLSFMC